MAYPFNEIEKKWQKYWADNKTFRTITPSPVGEGGGEARPKYYALDMFPYPSGAGLHVGHPLGYIASDIVSRYKRLKGFNVLHPMGYDSFGLPAEQYAIQTGQHPEKTTKVNIARYREQMDKIGFSFDWDREVRTSDPAYYKWTQWIFIKLFNSWYNPETDKAESLDTLIPTLKNFNSLSEKEKSDLLMNYRLAYLSEAWVNWCPQLGTVLANEEVKDGVSERGGYPVERKLMPQWSLRITSYANRLLSDLDTIEWTESIKEAQRNWIGKSEGSSLRFHLSLPSGTQSSRTGSPSPQERGESFVSEPMQEYYTTDGQMWNLLVDKAKVMRKNPTQAESALWESLRRKVTGYKVRRQHLIDRFIVDFVFLSKMLVIEVDGDIHDLQKEEDQARTNVLNSHGFKVIRFGNEEVLHDVDGVVSKIIAELNKLPDSEPTAKIFKEDAEEYSLTPPVRNSSPSLGERGLGGEVIEVFTTRPDTIFGVTFLTFAPESELVSKITTPENKKAVEEYIHYAKNRSERERQADVKKITGQFTGAYAIHPFTGAKIPVWIGDYVLAGYGTGAVMAVPAHDTRDFAFAKHFNLPIVYVIQPPANSSPEGGGGEGASCYDAKEGKCINSDFLNGLEIKDSIKRAIQEIESKGLGKGKTQFRLRDAIFGRQRYWGEPIPIYYENGIPKVVEEKHLPVELPKIDKYLPTETGEPPLARAQNWYYNPDMGITSPPLRTTEHLAKVASEAHDRGGALELTTMPGWAGSSWYYLRYMDPQNKNEFASKEALNYWQNVDLYIGGAEHATGHLLYVRFWTKFLYDLNLIPVIEPAKKLINQGMIQGVSPFGITLNLPSGPKIISSTKIDFKNKTTVVDGMKIENLSYHRFRLPLVWVEFIGDECRLYRDLVISKAKQAEGFPIHIEIHSDAYDWEVDASGRSYIVVETEVEKMSKSKWNVVTPDIICNDFGADTLRLYEMFLGPLEQSKPWSTSGISGVSGFLNRFWRLFHIEHKSLSAEYREEFSVSDEEPNKAELKVLHKTIKKIQQDIENYSFNTSVSSFMIATNELTDLSAKSGSASGGKCNKRAILEPMVILLSSFAPHISEELWEKLGHTKSITFASFPAYNEALMTDDSFAYPISFNGKMRFNLELPLSLTPAEIEKEVLANEQSKKFLEGKHPKKVIVVPKRIVNIVM